MGYPRPLFHLFSVFFKQFVQQINVKNVQSPSSIRTHNLSNMSRHPLPLGQGSRPLV